MRLRSMAPSTRPMSRAFAVLTLLASLVALQSTSVTTADAAAPACPTSANHQFANGYWLPATQYDAMGVQAPITWRIGGWFASPLRERKATK